MPLFGMVAVPFFTHVGQDHARQPASLVFITRFFSCVLVSQIPNIKHTMDVGSSQ